MSDPDLPMSPDDAKKAARAAYKRQYYLAHREEIQEKAKLKKLADPEKIRQQTHESYLRNREKILAQQKLYNDTHREDKAAADRIWRLANKEKIREKKKASYQANREQIRQKAQENYLKNREKVLAKNREWHDANPEALRIIKQRYKDKNREKVRAQGRVYAAQRRIEHPEEAAEYYAANREQIRERIKARMPIYRPRINARQQERRAENPDYDRNWRKAHPEVTRLKQERRRARQLGLPDTFTKQERQFMLEYWHYACAVCGNQEGLWWTLADDHWIPINSPNCPGTVAENIIPLCHTRRGQHGSCNITKHDQDPQTWLAVRVGAKKAKQTLKAIETYFAIVRSRRVQDAAD